MGALVITKDSWLGCSHQVAPGAGLANNGLASKLVVSGVEVMLAGDLDSVSIGATACPVVTDESKGTTKCSTTTVRTSGDATKLRVGGEAVLTEDAGGHTDGKPPPPPGPTYSVIDPRQTKLRTV